MAKHSTLPVEGRNRFSRQSLQPGHRCIPTVSIQPETYFNIDLNRNGVPILQ